MRVWPPASSALGRICRCRHVVRSHRIDSADGLAPGTPSLRGESQRVADQGGDGGHDEAAAVCGRRAHLVVRPRVLWRRARRRLGKMRQWHGQAARVRAAGMESDQADASHHRPSAHPRGELPLGRRALAADKDVVPVAHVSNVGRRACQLCVGPRQPAVDGQVCAGGPLPPGVLGKLPCPATAQPLARPSRQIAPSRHPSRPRRIQTCCC